MWKNTNVSEVHAARCHNPEDLDLKGKVKLPKCLTKYHAMKAHPMLN